MAELPIRPLTAIADFDRCVALQIATWGYSDGDVVPRRVFLLASRIGGQVLGAFAGESIVGFAMALPGVRGGVPYLHSHMLAVLPEYRNQGLGRRLKLAQREEALARGIDRIEWTFDPLEVRNAYLNIARLGAIVRRYEPDFYGASSSPLQGGLPTDRMIAEWVLASDYVRAVLRGESGPCAVTERVEVPAAVAKWKSKPELRERAVDLQSRIRMQLQDAFARGLLAGGFELDEERNGTYLLMKDERFWRRMNVSY